MSMPPSQKPRESESLLHPLWGKYIFYPIKTAHFTLGIVSPRSCTIIIRQHQKQASELIKGILWSQSNDSCIIDGSSLSMFHHPPPSLHYSNPQALNSCPLTDFLSHHPIPWTSYTTSLDITSSEELQQFEKTTHLHHLQDSQESLLITAISQEIYILNNFPKTCLFVI